ncbi:hypothetical protein [Dorea sp.]|uniref:hypothetical protein n=1 Tax=Dorea sp. TaxID=2040332 RepID=UPI0035286E7D
MYLSELFLQSLNGSYDTNTALIALEICNKELCGRMNGVEEEAECIRYFSAPMRMERLLNQTLGIRN